MDLDGSWEPRIPCVQLHQEAKEEERRELDRVVQIEGRYPSLRFLVPNILQTIC